MAVPKEQIRQIISQDNINSVPYVNFPSIRALNIFFRNLWRQNGILLWDMKNQKGE